MSDKLVLKSILFATSFLFSEFGFACSSKNIRKILFQYREISDIQMTGQFSVLLDTKEAKTFEELKHAVIKSINKTSEEVGKVQSSIDEVVKLDASCRIDKLVSEFESKK